MVKLHFNLVWAATLIMNGQCRTEHEICSGFIILSRLYLYFPCCIILSIGPIKSKLQKSLHESKPELEGIVF